MAGPSMVWWRFALCKAMLMPTDLPRCEPSLAMCSLRVVRPIPHCLTVTPSRGEVPVATETALAAFVPSLVVAAPIAGARHDAAIIAGDGVLVRWDPHGHRGWSAAAVGDRGALAR